MLRCPRTLYNNATMHKVFKSTINVSSICQFRTHNSWNLKYVCISFHVVHDNPCPYSLTVKEIYNVKKYKSISQCFFRKVVNDRKIAYCCFNHYLLDGHCHGKWELNIFTSHSKQTLYTRLSMIDYCLIHGKYFI